MENTTKIEPTYVTFKQAKLLKEKGFDEACSHYYINDFQNFKHDGILYKCGLPDSEKHKNTFQFVRRKNQLHICNAPEHWQVVNWLLINHNIWVTADVDCRDFFDANLLFFFRICDIGENLKCIYSSTEKYYKTPKEAYSAAFDYILNNKII